MKDNDFATGGHRSLLKRALKFAGAAGYAGRSHLEKGDAARDRRDWPTAALHYRDALAEQPGLHHIWIQLGHAEKENGDLDAAEDAYRTAETLGHGDGEPALHLGHVAKLRGDLAEAKRHYLRAVDNNPDNADAMRELSSFGRQGNQRGLRKALHRRADERAGRSEELASAIDAVVQRLGTALDPAARDTLDATKALLAQLDEQSTEPTTPGEKSSLSIVFDASDLFSYFRNARLPTGIQRVQIEVIAHALAAQGGASVCFFTDASDHWIRVPQRLFLELSELALRDGDQEAPEWLAAIDELDALLILEEPMQFEQGAFLVNLGTSWWMQNYFMFVRAAKDAHDIKYVPFVHDLIPIMAPEQCVKELTQDFVSWTAGVFQHADFYLVNSEATKRDLIKVASVLGHDLEDEGIAVIPLGADFRRPGHSSINDTALREWDIEAKGYVLIVSTIESRKNHLLAFDAWLDLIDRHGAQNVPKLVCVGNRGWLNDAIYARLQNDTLREHVVMLSRLSDAELALLYRNCLFTLYPSLYEGWGLPVTESLCYAKIPLVSDSSSLPEAGGDFAVYFASGARKDLIERLEQLIYDDTFRAEREEAIRSGFRPSSWTEIGNQIQASLQAFSGSASDTRARFETVYPAALGRYHPIERNFERTIWRGFVSGEIFRAGSGWWGPDSWGCWTRPKGAKLRMGVPEDSGALRAYFLLHGIPGKECDFTIDVNDGTAWRLGTLQPGEARWITVDIPENRANGLIEATFKGTAQTDLASHTDNLDRRRVSVGVAGFFLCEASDVLARLSITEAIALRDEASMAFNRRQSPGEELGLRAKALRPRQTR